MYKPFYFVSLIGIALTAGCNSAPEAPRFVGRVVSHVDTYNSGTGMSSNLSADGAVTSGFHYGDDSKPDWTSEVKWKFLRRDAGKDVYRIEWTFRPAQGNERIHVDEVSFDGTKPAVVAGNQFQVISLEPPAHADRA